MNDKSLQQEWESKLAKFGLSWVQINQSDVQYVVQPKNENGFGIAFDKELKGRHYFNEIRETHGVSGQEADAFNLVPTRTLPHRQVPAWFNDDNKVRALLFHLYPSLAKEAPRGQRDAQENAATRQRAARCFAMLYLAYRCNFTNAAIGEAFERTEGAVHQHLCDVNRKAEKFFEAKRQALIPGMVRAHNCVGAGMDVRGWCRCKQYIPHDDAKEMVKQGAAEWLWVYPPKENAYPCHGAVVVGRAAKAPRGALLQKAHIERAMRDGQQEERDSIAAYHEIEREAWASLIKPFRPDPFEGRAMIIRWADERTSTGHIGDGLDVGLLLHQRHVRRGMFVPTCKDCVDAAVQELLGAAA